MKTWKCTEAKTGLDYEFECGTDRCTIQTHVSEKDEEHYTPFSCPVFSNIKCQWIEIDNEKISGKIHNDT